MKYKKIVVIGGGHGNAVMLRSLREYTSDITAIVSVADDGGSSGKLRRTLNIPPPGDLRNCIIALADPESKLSELFDFRFNEGFLRWHNVGNLIIAALIKINGSLPLAIKQVSEVLAIEGRVLPVTTEQISMKALLSTGRTVEGESHIPKYCAKTRSRIEQVTLTPNCPKAMPECIRAILEADAVVYSPGSLYTSLIPNLLVEGICEALETSKADKYYIVNAMTQRGETAKYSIEDHILGIEKHSGGKNIIDYVIYNTQKVDDTIIKRYDKEGAGEVSHHISKEYKKKYKLIGIPCITIDDKKVIHDSEAIWKCILDI